MIFLIAYIILFFTNLYLALHLALVGHSPLAFFNILGAVLMFGCIVMRLVIMNREQK